MLEMERSEIHHGTGTIIGSAMAPEKVVAAAKQVAIIVESCILMFELA
jgi:hypothetical protein